MAGVKNGIVGQDEKFFADSLGELLEIAVGEIGAAHAAGENNIAHENDRRLALFDLIHDMARSNGREFRELSPENPPLRKYRRLDGYIGGRS